jgi:hypothetical protein
VVSCDSSVRASYGCMLTRATRKYATRVLSQIAETVCHDGFAVCCLLCAAAAVMAPVCELRCCATLKALCSLS